MNIFDKRSVVDYFKMKQEITDNCSELKCDKCPLCSLNNKQGLCCKDYEMFYPEKAANDIFNAYYPQYGGKTYEDDFREKFPDAQDSFVYHLCVEEVYPQAITNCNSSVVSDDSCRECWKRAIKLKTKEE